MERPRAREFSSRAIRDDGPPAPRGYRIQEERNSFKITTHIGLTPEIRAREAESETRDDVVGEWQKEASECGQTLPPLAAGSLVVSRHSSRLPYCYPSTLVRLFRTSRWQMMMVWYWLRW